MSGDRDGANKAIQAATPGRWRGGGDLGGVNPSQFHTNSQGPTVNGAVSVFDLLRWLRFCTQVKGQWSEFIGDKAQHLSLLLLHLAPQGKGGWGQGAVYFT